jgi:hypothetical protein
MKRKVSQKSADSVSLHLIVLGAIAFATLVISGFVATRMNAQDGIVTIVYLSGKEPIKAFSFNIRKKRFAFNERFYGSSDWLRDFSINVQNPTGKTVTYIDIGVFVVRSKEQSSLPPFHFSISTGNRQAALERRASELLFGPSDSDGEILRVSTSESDYRDIRTSLTKLGYAPEIERVEIQIEEVGFSDGSLWSLGGWYRADPKDTKKLIRRDGSEIKSVAVVLEDEEQCVFPIYTQRTCGTSCAARHVGQTDTNEQAFRVTEGYEQCRIVNPDGSLGANCGSNTLVNLATVCPTPSPTPTPNCGPDNAGLCDFVWQSYCDCVANYGANAWNSSTCLCQDPFSPIVIDTAGNGFSLTNAANGVNFDLSSDGIPERLSWTTAHSDDAWLVFDRNGNNLIDNGSEMFGNYTLQPEPPAGELRNGFLALAVFDNPANGGNGDGQIDRRDSVFNRLRLWRDSNHNGVSDTNETRKLSLSPIRKLELNYQESRRVDEFGNAFRYRAIVRDEYGAQVGRWAWDVFLKHEVYSDELEKIKDTAQFSSLQQACGVFR